MVGAPTHLLSILTGAARKQTRVAGQPTNFVSRLTRLGTPTSYRYPIGQNSSTGLVLFQELNDIISHVGCTRAVWKCHSQIAVLVQNKYTCRMTN